MPRVGYAGSVVWAGVAIRHADGTIVAVEIDYPQGDLTVSAEAEDYMTAGGYVAYLPGSRWVDVKLTGALSRGWRDGEESARQRAAQAIDAPPLAIDAALPVPAPVERGPAHDPPPGLS